MMCYKVNSVLDLFREVELNPQPFPQGKSCGIDFAGVPNEESHFLTAEFGRLGPIPHIGFWAVSLAGLGRRDFLQVAGAGGTYSLLSLSNALLLGCVFYVYRGVKAYRDATEPFRHLSQLNVIVGSVPFQWGYVFRRPSLPSVFLSFPLGAETVFPSFFEELRKEGMPQPTLYALVLEGREILEDDSLHQLGRRLNEGLFAIVDEELTKLNEEVSSLFQKHSKPDGGHRAHELYGIFQRSLEKLDWIWRDFSKGLEALIQRDKKYHYLRMVLHACYSEASKAVRQEQRTADIPHLSEMTYQRSMRIIGRLEHLFAGASLQCNHVFKEDRDAMLSLLRS